MESEGTCALIGFQKLKTRTYWHPFSFSYEPTKIKSYYPPNNQLDKKMDEMMKGKDKLPKDLNVFD